MIFLLISLVLFYLVPKKIQWIVLLIGSIFFYCFYNYILGIYLLITVFTTWLGGILIYKYNKGYKVTERSRKSVLVYIFVVLVNFLILAAFKIPKLSLLVLNGVGFNLDTLILPIGLSFYTFQTIGYLTDVFRYLVKPQENLLKYALFASFFPQILSGPIGRYVQLSPQFFIKKNYNAVAVSMGAQRIIWGLFKKMVIADRIAVIVNEIYGKPNEYKGVYIIIGAMLFLIQLYADFSGLIDIAAGSAQMFQIELAPNFNTPLFARNISDFWNRWHISLSSWFKDYFFYPLIKSKMFQKLNGLLKRFMGKKKSKNTTTYIAMFLLWFAIGCWHGVQGNYIIGAGLIFGIYIVGGKILAPVFNGISKFLKINKECFSYKLFEVFRTFLLLSLAMVFWRAESLEKAFTMIKQFIKGIYNIWVLFDGSLLNLGLTGNEFLVMVISIIVLLSVDVLHYKGIKIREKLISQGVWFKWTIYILAVMSILLFGMYGPKYNASDFIYFNF